MNSTCPNCGVTYRIDPAKVPSGGIRARCTHCEGVFRVEPPAPADDAPTPPGSSSDVVAASPAPSPAASATTLAEDRPAEPAAEPASAPRFGVMDPHQQARRLARALISDIVVYHPDRRERSLAAGTLRQDFRDEIRKSWDEYVARVGDQIARQTPYFRDALNEILAGGAAVF